MTQKILQITLLASLIALSLSVGLRQQQDQQPQPQDDQNSANLADVLSVANVTNVTIDDNSTANTSDAISANTTNDTYAPYICPYNDPALTFCAAYIIDSCVCYANGTCAEVQTNSCNGCFDDDVVSVTEGEQCPSGNVSGRYVRCQTSQPDSEICPLYVIQGCICYSNGTCQAGEVNACSDCRDNDTLLVIENGDCPTNGIANGLAASKNGSSVDESQEEEEEQAEDLDSNEGFKPDVCPDYTLIDVNCIQIARNSCACYANGTCANVETNACVYCQQAVVVSVNENEQCPSQGYNGTLTVCKYQPEDTVCTLQITDGCACYRNGTCIAGPVNACNNCLTNNQTVLVIENGSCPENGIEARE